MLKINKLNVDIGLIQILKNVSLDLEKGQMVGLIGRNGAGKTTLLRAIMGILKTKSGELIFEENDLKNCLHKKEHTYQLAICRKIENLFLQ